MKINTRYGEMEIPQGKDLISLSLEKYGEWSQKEVDMLLGFIQPGSVVIDIGGYIGSHARAFSTVVGGKGRVLTFEPNIKAFRYLEKNTNLSPVNNIKSFNFALGASAKKMSIAYEKEQQNMGASSLQISAEGYDEVKVEKMDALGISDIDLIKIDVEGMEIDVLEGGLNTIKESQPVIFIEVNSVEKSHNSLQWCSDNGYTAHGIIADAYNPENFNRDKNNFFGEAKECGLILVPEKHSDFVGKGLERLSLPLIETRDDIVLLLLHKPQYPYEVLEKAKSHKRMGLNYPSPRLDFENNKNIELIAQLEKELTKRRQIQSSVLVNILRTNEDIREKKVHVKYSGSLDSVIDSLSDTVSQIGNEITKAQEELEAEKKDKFALEVSFNEKIKNIEIEKDEVIGSLSSEVERQKKFNDELLGSRSWKLTAPLRTIFRILNL